VNNSSSSTGFESQFNKSQLDDKMTFLHNKFISGSLSTNRKMIS